MKRINLMIIFSLCLLIGIQLQGNCKFLNRSIKNSISQSFKNLKKPVKIIEFTQEIQCQSCVQNSELIKEVAELSPLIKVVQYDFLKDAGQVKKYEVDKVPATLIEVEGKTYGIKFYGVPAGYEFKSFIAAIEELSSGETPLTAKEIETIKNLKKPVHIQVLVTPTCPYCPAVVELANQLAFYNDKIKAETVELIEFPHIAQKYNVIGVPTIVLNDKVYPAVNKSNLIKAIVKLGE